MLNGDEGPRLVGEVGHVAPASVGSESAFAGSLTGEEGGSRLPQALSEAKPGLDASSSPVECGLGNGDGARRAWGRLLGEPLASRGEDEALPVRPSVTVKGRKRNVLIQLPAETYDRLESIVVESGVPRAHFLSVALLAGARRVADQL